MDLASAGVDLRAARLLSGQQWIDIAKLPTTEASLDSHGLVLDLTVPAQWLPQQHIGSRRPSWEEPRSGFGAVISYDAHVSRHRTAWSERQSSHAALWSEQRIFGNRGVISNSGVWRHMGGEMSLPGVSGYRRFDTTWTWPDERNSTSVTFGDVITGAQSWGSAIRLGGVKLAQDHRLRPDLITYPLPQYSGRASLPSTVDLFVDGRRVSGGRVAPGPFLLEGLPFMNGAGEATIVTTDALGRQSAITLPFYVSSDLLRAGFANGSISAGFIRRAYGIENLSYGKPAATAVVRHGINDRLTGEFQFDLAPGLSVIGAGAVLGIGRFGVVNGSVSRSEFHGSNGRQLSFGYRYAQRGFSAGYRGSRRDEHFADFGSLSDELAMTPVRARRTDIGTLGFSMGDAGAFSIGYFDALATDESRVRLAVLSYSVPLRRRNSLHVSTSRDLHRGGHGMLVQLIVPLGPQGSASTAFSRDKQGGYSTQLGYSRSAPTDGGFGWNIGHSWHERSHSYRHASLSWSNRHLQTDFGSYGTRDDRTDWAGLRGSFVVMEGRAFAARQIHDAFTLVSTSGIENVPVRYENQLIGRTDQRGHLLVPNVSSYYGAKYEIDPLNLPTGLRIPSVEQRVAVRRGSGALLSFPIEPVSAALISLVDEADQPLPLGTVVVHADTLQEAIVGYDGFVYLENLGARNALTARRPGGQDCRVSFELDPTDAEMTRVGPLHCE